MADDWDERAKAFAALIRQARKDKGWDQITTAEKAGVSRSTLMRYEAGHAANPDPGQVRKICVALDVDRRWVAVFLGYLSVEEIYPEPGAIQEVIQILEDSDVPNATKRALLNQLAAAKNRYPGLSASERFCAAIGKPHPAPLSGDELAEFERLQDEVDADLARRYGGARSNVA